MRACICELEIDKDDPLEFVRSWSDTKGVYAEFKPVFTKEPKCGKSSACEKDVKYKWSLSPAIPGTAVIDGADDGPSVTVKHELSSSVANVKIALSVTVTVTCSMTFKSAGSPTVVMKRHKSDSGTDGSILF